MTNVLGVSGIALSTIELARCDTVSNEGTTGAVEKKNVEQWVEHCLGPILRKHIKG